MARMPDKKKRQERYDSAKRVMDLWRSTLEDAYDYCFPYRNDIDMEEEGQTTTSDIWDETAVISAHQFANNLQYIMMPPFQRWIQLEAGEVIAQHTGLSDEDRKQINEKLQKDTEILFQYLDASNFHSVLNETFQDLAIGTGFIQINEGDLAHPLKFSSISIGKVAVAESENGRLENVWRKWNITLREIQEKWPDAKLPASVVQTMSNNPEAKKCLIEGCLYYPENKPEERYFYYVMLKENHEDIYVDWMESSPFVVYRYSKAPSETLGIGVIQYALPAIKTVNKMAELDLRAFKFRAFPAYIDASGRSINPNTARIEPGSLIPVSPDFASRMPIQPLAAGGDPRFAALAIEQKQQMIREIMLAEPLGDITDTPTKTATEISIRQRNYIQRNTASAARLAVECIKPIIERCLYILRKKGLIQDITTAVGVFAMEVKDKTVNINYKTPIGSLQDNQDVQSLMNWMQVVGQIYGQAGAVMALERYEIPQWVATKLGMDLDLVKDAKEFEKNVEEAGAQAQQLQQAMGQAQQQMQQQAPQEG
jgi:hypothetical protein